MRRSMADAEESKLELTSKAFMKVLTASLHLPSLSVVICLFAATKFSMDAPVDAAIVAIIDGNKE